MEYQENSKRTNKTTTTTASSSSTRVRAYAREEYPTLAERTLLEMAINTLRQEHMDILGRPMPRFTESQLTRDLEQGTPSVYYRYALAEAANAPMPSWRYVLAIVARLKRQNVPEDDLLWL